MLELRPAAARQYIDSVAVFEAHEEALVEAAQVRGGMYWHKGPVSTPEVPYLVRTTPAGGETSLGPRSPATQGIYDRFTERKRASDERLAGLKASLQDHRRLNRALRVGRVDPLIVEILNRLAASKLAEHFRVVGTHALYAYEAAASITFDADAVATRDIDLLWDTRKRVQFATRLAKIDTSMIGVLKKVDPTFRIRNAQKYTAVNKDGFEVDIIRREPVDGDPNPLRLSRRSEAPMQLRSAGDSIRGTPGASRSEASRPLNADEGDFWVAQAPNAQFLLHAPAFSAVVVASNGAMARMTTLHPLAFAKFKRWIAQRADRDPAKRRRDALQAGLVEAMVQRYLPQLSESDSAATTAG